MSNPRWFEKACEELEGELERGEIEPDQFRQALRELIQELDEQREDDRP